MFQLCWIICLFVASFVYYAASLRSYLAIITHEIMSGQFCQSNLLFYHIYLSIYKLLYGNINSFHHSIPHSNPYSIPKIRDTHQSVLAAKSPNLMSAKCTTPTVCRSYALFANMTYICTYHWLLISSCAVLSYHLSILIHHGLQYVNTHEVFNCMIN